MFINGRKKVGIIKLKYPKALTDYSQTIDDVYENLEDYNLTKRRRVLIVLDNMISDIESNKKHKSFCYWTVFERKKTQYFGYFYIGIIKQCNTLFYYENS